jgi:HEAT repeat protein
MRSHTALRREEKPHPRHVLLSAVVVLLALFGLFGPNVLKLKEKRNISGLALALEDKDPEVQYRAAEALGDIGEEKSVAPLIAAMTRSEYSGVRWKAAEALSKVGDPAVGSLITLLRHPDEDVRWQAAIALGEIGNPEAIEPLIVLMGDGDRYVRSRAAVALGLIGRPALQRLTEVLANGEITARCGAAAALGQTKDPDVIESLIRALADPETEVRVEVAAALAAIGKPATGSLIQFLKFTGGERRVEVVRALGQLHASDAIEPLIQILEKADDRERQEVADALDAILAAEVRPMVARIRNGNNHTKENGTDTDRGENS